MTTVAKRAESPGVLELNPEDGVSRSATIVQATGYRVVPTSHPIGPRCFLKA